MTELKDLAPTEEELAFEVLAGRRWCELHRTFFPAQNSCDHCFGGVQRLARAILDSELEFRADPPNLPWEKW